MQIFAESKDTLFNFAKAQLPGQQANRSSTSLCRLLATEDYLSEKQASAYIIELMQRISSPDLDEHLEKDFIKCGNVIAPLNEDFKTDLANTAATFQSRR